MITCSLDIGKTTLEIAQQFLNFNTSTVIDLVTQLEEFYLKLKLCAIPQLSQIHVHLGFTDVTKISVPEKNALYQFVVSKSDILFRIVLLERQSLSADVSEFLQKHLDEAFWQVAQAWHENHSSGGMRLPLEHLLTSLFPSGLPSPTLTIVQHQPEALATHPEIVLEMPKIQGYPKLLESASQSHSHFGMVVLPRDRYKDTVMALLSEDIYTTIFSCVGKTGVDNFCEHISFFSDEQLTHLISLFFSGAKQKDILHLFTPLGMSFIKTCAQWPKRLIPHWLHWLNLTNEPMISFFDAVNLMDYFWQRIKNFHPDIEPQFAQGKFPFVQRISGMLALLDSCTEEGKKAQVSYLFSLDWHLERPQAEPLQYYIHIMKHLKPLFISRDMMLVPFEYQQPLLPLKQPSISSCMQYVALHLQDKTPLAVEQIKLFLQQAERQGWSHIGYQLVAWFSGAPTMIEPGIFQSLCELLFGAAEASQASMLQHLFAIESKHRWSADDLNMVLGICAGNLEQFLGLVQLYGAWSGAKGNIFSGSWQVVIGFLKLQSNSQRLQYLFSLTPLLTQDDAQFSTIYLKALLVCIAQHQHDIINEELLAVIERHFLVLNPIRQSELLAILASYAFKADMYLNIEPLSLLLAQAVEEVPLQELFERHYPSTEFLYFKSAIDYQLIFNKIETLIQSAKGTIDFFLSDEKFYGVLNIKTLLLEDVIVNLTSQQALLKRLLAEIQVLRLQKNNIVLTPLFTHLKQFDDFFVNFIEWKLARVFGEKSIMLYGYGMMGPLIQRLDPGLNATSMVKDLMDKVFKHHKLVSQISLSLADYFQEGLLDVLLKTSDTPILERYLDYRLVQGVAEDLKKDIAVKWLNSSIPLNKLNILINFLHRIPLSQEGVNDFFKRFLVIKVMLKAWMGMEQKLSNAEIDPELVWDILVANQLNNGMPYSNAFWPMAMHLLQQIFEWQSHQGAMKDFPLVSFLDNFFRAKQALASVDIYSSGELKHPHWVFLMQTLARHSSQFAQQPRLLTLLPQAIKHILQTGSPFDFAQNSVFFSQFSQYPDLLDRLLLLMNHPQRDIQVKVQTIFILMGDLLSTKDKRSWSKIIYKIFGSGEFEANIDDIEPFLKWLVQHSQFYCWLDMIAFDDKSTLGEVLSLWRLMQHDSIWKRTYEQSFLHQHVAHQIAQPEPTKEQTNNFNVFFSWVPWFWASSNAQSPEPYEQQMPAPNTELAKDAWVLWSKAPYPSVRQMVCWLEQDPEAIKSELLLFNQYPLGMVTAYAYSDQDMLRWMKELEFYQTMAPGKDQVKQRLHEILQLTNNLLALPRTALLEQFHQLVKKIRKQTKETEIELQHALVAVIAAVYYKSTNRKPYPTQLLTILLCMAYQGQNILFEVDTGEGKGITTALLAVLKWALRKDATVEVRTANRDLVRQDFYEKGHWQFFKFLGIGHAIIEPDSPLETYVAGGIFYTTQDDMNVFLEYYRHLAGYDNKFTVDVLADEVDSLLLDQSRMINLARSKPSRTSTSWLYLAINEFVNQHCRGATWEMDGGAEQQLIIESVQRIQANSTFTQPTEIVGAKVRVLLAQYAKLLKEAIALVNQKRVYRLVQIEKITDEQWQDYLVMALYARRLKENQDFLVEVLDVEGQKFHKTVPIINGQVKYGFELSFQMKSALTPLVHAYLQDEERLFLIEAEVDVIGQLPALDLRHLNSFVGMSGSIGLRSELSAMMEYIQGSAVRIPRFYQSNLELLPNALLDNYEQLDAYLLEKLSTSAHPTLLVTEKIEDAKRLSSTLMHYFPSRPICLLTGKEPREKRSDWLNANHARQYAGSAHSITVATLICGRGTDILVNPPLYLQVLQIGILEPRSAVQIRGRTARVNFHGSYQCLHIKEHLLKDWGHFSAALPELTLSSLPLWIDKIQEQLIYNSRQRRLKLRMSGWSQKHLTAALDVALKPLHLNALEKQTYHLMVAHKLQLIAQCGSKNVDEVAKQSIDIWQKVLAHLELMGHGKSTLSLSSFTTGLQSDKDGYLSLVNQSLMAEAKYLMQDPKKEVFNGQSLEQMKDVLTTLVPQEWHFLDVRPIAWYDLIGHLKAWLYSLPSLTLKTNELLHRSWKEFIKTPTATNWDLFYQNLCAAYDLYMNQKPHVWSLAYWFPSLNPLHAWMPLWSEAHYQLNPDYLLQSEQGFLNSIKQQLLDITSSFKKMPRLWQDILDWWKNLMGFFNADIEETLQELHYTALQFQTNPNGANFSLMRRQLHQAKQLFVGLAEWRSLRLGYWVFWHKRCQTWIDLATEMESSLQAQPIAQPVVDWQQQQHAIGEMQLSYRNYLVDKSETFLSSGDFSFWSSNNVRLHAQNNATEVSEDANYQLDKNIILRHQLLELGRLYPDEIQTHFSHCCFTQHNAGVMQPLSAYFMLLVITYVYSNSERSEAVQEYFASIPLTVLIAEIRELIKKRELLVLEENGLKANNVYMK